MMPQTFRENQVFKNCYSVKKGIVKHMHSLINSRLYCFIIALHFFIEQKANFKVD